MPSTEEGAAAAPSAAPSSDLRRSGRLSERRTSAAIQGRAFGAPSGAVHRRERRSVEGLPDDVLLKIMDSARSHRSGAGGLNTNNLWL